MKFVASKMKFFLCQEIFYVNFDFKNGCKNEFKDNIEKSRSWSRNRVSRKIDFKAQWLRNGHADSVGVNFSASKKLKNSLTRRILARKWLKFDSIDWNSLI